jgi:acetolactate synthase-1/2/3 large subunit
MADVPAATLLHLGCGLGNGLANLHNARKGRVPVVNVVGDHATHHVGFDAPLQSDIGTVARNVSTWVRTSASTGALCEDAVQAVAAAMGPPGQVATLILPADVSWSEGGAPAAMPARPAPPVADDATIDAIARAVRSGEPAALLLGGRALREPALLDAARIAARHGTTLLAEVFPTRIERGAGLPHVERIAYLAELASVQLDGLRHLILVDAKSPVSFFAYPGRKGDLVPQGCTVHVLASFEQDADAGLARLAERLGAQDAQPALQAPSRPARPRGRLTAEKACKAVGAVLPENAIVVDEAQTSGVLLAAFTRGAPRHDVLTLTGGAIGQGLPVATGAAIACPGRPVLALCGDGAAMYTPQALWTMARERLDVTAVVFDNRSYAILEVELQRVGAQGRGEKARAQLDLSDPPLDFVRIAEGMGVPAVRVDTSEAFTDALERALRTPGPHLIQAAVPPVFTGLKLRLLPRLLSALGSLPRPVARAIKRKVAP